MAKNSIEVDRGDPPVAKKVLAQAIVDISKAMTDLAASGLPGRVSKDLLAEVFRSLRDLRAAYCR